MQAKARASPTGPSDLRKLHDLRFPKSHSGRAFLVPPTARQRKHGTINHPREGGLPDDIPTVGVQALDGASEGKGEGSLEFYLITTLVRLQSSGEGSLCMSTLRVPLARRAAGSCLPYSGLDQTI
jgi:hypothetical protein